MKLLQVFIFSFISTFIFGQARIDTNKQAKFRQLYQEQERNTTFSFEDGQKLLSLAQNNYEKALAYMVMGEAKYEIGDYLSSVNFLEKSEGKIGSTDSLNIEIRIINQLLTSYRRAGLIESSDKKFAELNQVAQKVDPEKREAVLLGAQAKIYDIDGEYCKAADLRSKLYENALKTPLQEPFKSRFLFAVTSQLAYVQFKCGKVSDARKSLQESEAYKTMINSKERLLLKDMYFLNKALIFHSESKNDLSRKYFDSALAESKESKYRLVQKLILSERLDANMDPADEQLKFAETVKDINDSESRVTKDLMSKETRKAYQLIAEHERRQNWLIATIAIVVITTGVGIYFYRRKTEKVKTNYQKIIADLKQQSTNNREEKTTDNYTSDIKIHPDTEQNILNSLQKFEDKNQFTKSGISLAQMAVLLNTNTKYLNHILKKYRDADFNTYINTYRINYITKALREDPKLRNYKISALSDICGYSSHSQFTSIFKAKTNISPSQYISMLKQEK